MREIVRDTLKQRGKSTTWLARRMYERGACSEATIYRWLSGRGDACGRVIGVVLDELGIEVGNFGIEWGTVRLGDTVVVCRVGSETWFKGSWRVVHGTKQSAEISASERLKYLTGASRSHILSPGASGSGAAKPEH